MTKEQTDNELIAEFMELNKETVHGEFLYYHTNYKGINWGYEIHNLEYHKSWDWLMPVVQKIDSIKNPFKWRSNLRNKKYQEFVAMQEGVTEQFINSEINIVYESVVEFIKWYNQYGK